MTIATRLLRLAEKHSIGQFNGQEYERRRGKSRALAGFRTRVGASSLDSASLLGPRSLVWLRIDHRLPLVDISTDVRDHVTCEILD